MFFRPFFFAPVESGLFGFSFGIGQPGEELGIALPWWGFQPSLSNENLDQTKRWEDKGMSLGQMDWWSQMDWSIVLPYVLFGVDFDLSLAKLERQVDVLQQTGHY